MFNKIAMIGLGYIGLPTAAMMASRGMNVIGVDINEDTVNTIKEGKVHIVEPDLDIIVRSVVTTGNLVATTEIEEADVFLIAVPTPLDLEKRPDLSFIRSATKSISKVLKSGDLLILESTVPVGTTEKLSEWLSELCPNLKFPHKYTDKADVQISHCPERVLPGHVIRELVENDRIIGGLSKKCAERAIEFYKHFVKGNCISTNARTAELSKLSENAFRDVNIAFANELSVVCDQVDVGVWELIELVNRHPRVNVLQPGPGVGGHCIAVDPWFIVETAPEHAQLIRKAREINDNKPLKVIEKVIEKADRYKLPVIACFGISFKANIDDLRESPALEIVTQLAKLDQVRILIVEPNVEIIPQILANNNIIEFVDVEKALDSADIVVGLVDHDEFKNIPSSKLKDKNVIDVRGIWT